MSEQTVPTGLLEELRKYDTPTICNALEVVMGGRRATGFTTEQFVCADPALPAIVGYARTATIRATEPPRLSADELRQQRLAYYEYIAAPPQPTVVVMQDIDARPGLGAWWGEVHSLVHSRLGSLGVVTNGSIRDLDVAAPGFQMLAGKISPSHAFVYVVDFGHEVNVFGLTVRHQDIIHADKHGAVLIPYDTLPKLTQAIDLMARREKLILDAARQPGFSVAALRQAMAAGDDIH